MTITPLGSGQEVGRSCHLVTFRGTTILLDCGIHPGYDGMSGLPYFDNVDPATVDVVLITHFHLDHVASLPYFTERTGFVGRVFMTHPTKAVTRLLLGDYLRLMAMKRSGSNNDDNSSSVLYTEAELQSCIDKIELVDYHQTMELDLVSGLKFHALNAGHVLGAAMFHIELGGRTILYTGDYSMEEDRHLMAAEIPHTVNPDVLIVESTYGVQVHASRAEREARFTGTIERIVTGGGRCLIPVFALGRAQELLLILDEYWQDHPHLRTVPIYYASKMASRALRVYQTYANMMNVRIRKQMDLGNPFAFRHIRNLKSIDVNSFDDRGPSVVFASPGMLQSGVSRQLFDRWASDPKNGCLIAGYAVEHTLAKEIMSQPREVVTMEGRRQPLNCLVDYVSFSAHVDFVQNRDFITTVNPRNIVLVHGAKEEMGRLKGALMMHYNKLPEKHRPTIAMPPNEVEVKLIFTRRRSAKIMGKLAAAALIDRINVNNNDDDDVTTAKEEEEVMTLAEPREGDPVRGILVTQQNSSRIVAPEDLSTYTPLRVGSVSSRLHVPFVGKIVTLRMFLKEMFQGISESREGDNDDDNLHQEEVVDSANVDEDGDIVTFSMHGGQVKVIAGKTRGVVTVEWDCSSVGDVIADSVVALIMHAQGSAASIRLTSQPCNHRRKKPREGIDGAEDEDQQKDDEAEVFLRALHQALKDQFLFVEATYEANKGTFEVRIDANTVKSGKEGDEDNDDNNEEEVDGGIVCVAIVEFNDGFVGTAKITVKSEDEKLASNVRACLQNVATASAPIALD
jgi:cleavage and polyadenylation specificity factor subunit 3